MTEDYNLIVNAIRAFKSGDFSARLNSSNQVFELNELCLEVNGLFETIEDLRLTIKNLEKDSLSKSAELKAKKDEYSIYENELQKIGLLLEEQAQKRMQAEKEKDSLYRRLIESSRLAGNSEIATGVLHNVGNILNSVNISVGIVLDKINESRLPALIEVIKLVVQNKNDIGKYLTEDEKGKLLIPYFDQIGKYLESEYEKLKKEAGNITDKLEHIKAIIQTQQKVAAVRDLAENAPITEFIERAIQINSSAFDRHHITLEKQYLTNEEVYVDTVKFMQIMINLLSNAKYALDSVKNPEDRKIVIKVEKQSDLHFRIMVKDNGIGINKENFSKIFQFGHTTREKGHGFGLHTSALHAKEIGGQLLVHSDGVGQGAEFTLIIPKNYKKAAA